MNNLKVGLAQINSTVGDLDGNTKKIVEFIRQAKLLNVDLLVFPELTLTGSPPGRLLLKRQFINNNIDCLQHVIQNSMGIALILGFVDYYNGFVYNSAAVVIDNKITAIAHKTHQSNSMMSTEIQYFSAGNGCLQTTIRGHGVEIAIGEDVLDSSVVVATWSGNMPRLLININANSYQIQDIYRQEDFYLAKAASSGTYFASVNMVGAQNGLIFAGGSYITGTDSKTIVRGKSFTEDMIVANLNLGASQAPIILLSENREKRINSIPAIYKSLVLGIKDYVEKNGFSKVVLGLSGGIDSSLVAAIAVDALGAKNVVGVSMPSRYSSLHSRTDVDKLVSNIGIKLDVISIEKAFCAFIDMLNLNMENNGPGVVEQNLQARVRANILYALSNKYGWMVLCCSNKSEAATGYGTLYGDIAGGFAVLKNIYKTMVFELASYRNSISENEIIPESIIIKEPSAELAPNQKDTDALPPYDVLDPILQAYMDRNISVNGIVDMGYDSELVNKIAFLVDRSEYKRRQSPPGVILFTNDDMK